MQNDEDTKKHNNKTKEEEKKKTVAIYGAGIAGLTAAHALCDEYDVTVYEAKNCVGGFFVSAQNSETCAQSEYSWHGIGPWYEQTRRLMHETGFIPHATTQTANGGGGGILAPRLHYAITRDQLNPPEEMQSSELQRTPLKRRVYKRFLRMGLSTRDTFVWLWSLASVWFAGELRATLDYALQLQHVALRRQQMRESSLAIWCSSFGPWIGVDSLRASVYHVGLFFGLSVYSLFSKLNNYSMMWNTLAGPSSSIWFDPWARKLEKRGVRFYLNAPLGRIFVAAPVSSPARLASDIEAANSCYATNKQARDLSKNNNHNTTTNNNAFFCLKNAKIAHTTIRHKLTTKKTAPPPTTKTTSSIVNHTDDRLSQHTNEKKKQEMDTRHEEKKKKKKT